MNYLEKMLCFRRALCKTGLLAMALGILLSCEAVGPEFAPVHGTLLQSGKPIAEARVVLHPLGNQATELPQPQATTDEQGHFTVTTLRGDDGAIPGKYAITVELRAPRRRGEETIRDGRNLLPNRFANPETSGIIKEVLAGTNDWPPIELPAK